MTTPGQSELCAICRMPKQGKSGGSITQWISVCRCDVAAGENASDASSAPVKFCSQCNKRIDEGRHGSFTQWIFRGETCQCARPIAQESFAPQAPSGDAAEFSHEADVEDEDELSLPAGSFPQERYKPLAILGRGAAGTVYMVRDRLLNKKVAVKVLNTLTAEQLVLFQQEAKAISKLNHPAIVQILDFGITEKSVPYMVLEYLQGDSLEVFLEKNGSLPCSRALEVFGRIADALSYAHENKIFHRDLKPSNIILVKNSVQDVRLIDFGVARLTGELQETTTIEERSLVGTPAYMSPEQIEAEPYDERSEIYSFGCVLFESLTGAPPFRADTTLDLLSLHLLQDPPRLAERQPSINFPKSLQGFVDKCLAKSRDYRFGDFKDALQSLQQVKIEDEQSFKQSTIGETTTFRIGKKKSRRGIVIGAVVSVIGVVIALFAFMQSNKPSAVVKPAKRSIEEARVKRTPKFTSGPTDVAGDVMDSWKTTDDMWGIKTLEEKPLAPGEAKFVYHDVDGKMVYEAISDQLLDQDLKFLLQCNPRPQNVSLRGCTRVTGVGLLDLKDLPIKELDLKWIRLSDEGAASLAQLQSIKRLNLCHVEMNPKRVQEVAKLKNLRYLYLCGCLLTDECTSPLSDLPSLTFLSIEGNVDLTYQAIKNMNKSTSLDRMRVYGCPKILEMDKLKKAFPACHFEAGGYAGY